MILVQCAMGSDNNATVEYLYILNTTHYGVTVSPSAAQSVSDKAVLVDAP